MKKNNFRKSIIMSISIILGVLIILSNMNIPIYAFTEETKIVLSDSKITVNEKEISTDSTESVYKTINIESNDDVTSEVENNVINITKAGIYRITGTAVNTQISINVAENEKVEVILDNVNITCNTAPAIIAYQALDDEKEGEAGFTITLADNSKNTIVGSHIPKDAKYTVDGSEKSYDAKYDGAISSDVSIKIAGNGYLKVEADKEGIETKKHLTVDGGNIEINAGDDAINASEDNVSVITINDGTIYANIKEDAKEGDGIDSNGYIYINGGKIYAFASAISPDSGLDSDLGIYINGGTVIATGNMVDEVSSESKQKYIFLQFNEQIQDNTLLCITDKNDNPIMAYKTDKEYKTFLYSNSNLNIDSYNVYKNGTINGEETNGLYTTISSYEKGEEANYTVADKNRGMGNMPQGQFGEKMPSNQDMNQTSTYIGIILVAIGILFFIIVVISIIKKNTKNNN